MALIGTGEESVRCLDAAYLLDAHGIDALVLHVPTLKPIDEETIQAVAHRTGYVVTAEDHSIIGGLGGAVAEILGEQQPTPLRRVGWCDLDAESAPNEPLLEKYGLTPEHVAETARRLLTA